MSILEKKRKKKKHKNFFSLKIWNLRGKIDCFNRGEVLAVVLSNRALSPTRWRYQFQVKFVVFLNIYNFFYKETKALAFNGDWCCHLALCLWLIIFLDTSFMLYFKIALLMGDRGLLSEMIFWRKSQSIKLHRRRLQFNQACNLIKKLIKH